MSKPVASGEKKTCQVCKEKGFTVEINAVESEYQGNKRLSWKNPDGTAHIKRQDDGTWMHTRLTTAPEQSKLITQTISPELDEIIQGCEKQMKESGVADAFAVEYMAVWNILLPYIHSLCRFDVHVFLLNLKLVLEFLFELMLLYLHKIYNYLC